MGRVAGPESKAQLGSGTSMPYISPPLIHARLQGRIKELKRHSRFGRLTGRNLGGYDIPLMLSQKTCYSGAPGSVVIIT